MVESLILLTFWLHYLEIIQLWETNVSRVSKCQQYVRAHASSRVLGNVHHERLDLLVAVETLHWIYFWANYHRSLIKQCPKILNVMNTTQQQLLTGGIYRSFYVFMVLWVLLKLHSFIKKTKQNKNLMLLILYTVNVLHLYRSRTLSLIQAARWLHLGHLQNVLSVWDKIRFTA